MPIGLLCHPQRAMKDKDSRTVCKVDLHLPIRLVGGGIADRCLDEMRELLSFALSDCGLKQCRFPEAGGFNSVYSSNIFLIKQEGGSLNREAISKD